MKYDLSSKSEVMQAKIYLENLISTGKLVNIVKVSKTRSLSQNNYLHLLLGIFGLHFGYTLEEAKLIYKELNKDVYAYVKKNRTFYKSSADLTVDEMAKSIDVLHKWSAAAGYPLPAATDEEWLRYVENEIERSKYYL